MSDAGGRGPAARIGLTLLNLWVPGLGLLRVGSLRASIPFLLLPTATLLLLLAWFAANDEFAFGSWAALMLVALIAQFGAWIGSMVLTWRRSGRRPEILPVASRWYVIVAGAIVLPCVGLALSDAVRANVRNFYIPSEAMMPTLVKNDRLVGAMHGPGDLRRGDIILFRMPRATYVKRVAALGGDRIAMKDGIVVLNGRAVPQRFLREEIVPDTFGPVPVRRLAERFPGEVAEHEIYDSGPSEVDDVEERTIPAGFVFVLGDHRDRSADSRVPRDAMGVELLPVGDIQGRAQFLTWPTSKIGRKVNR